jgi:hypothetical protein
MIYTLFNKAIYEENISFTLLRSIPSKLKYIVNLFFSNKYNAVRVVTSALYRQQSFNIGRKMCKVFKLL